MNETYIFDRLSIPSGIKDSLDKIFGAVIIGGLEKYKKDPAYSELIRNKRALARVTIPKFKYQFTFNIFNDSYAVFYEIISGLGIREFNENELDAIIDNNRDLILNSRYIDVSKYRGGKDGNVASDDDIIIAFTKDLQGMLDTLSLKDVSEETYNSAVMIYTDWYKDRLMEYTANNMAVMMSDEGVMIKQPNKQSKLYKGIVDAQNFYNENMAIIKSLSGNNQMRETVVDANWLESEIENEKKKDTSALFKTGIAEIDKTVGSLRRGWMLGVLGPPKGGKTRFSCYLAHKALAQGLNVCIWPLEGSRQEWESMLTACDIAACSDINNAASGKKEIFQVSSKDILEKRYLNNSALKKMVAGAKTRISTGEGYGVLSFIEGTAYIEDFLDVLEQHYRTKNPFDVLIIDQLINISTKRGKGKVERISEAYMSLESFLKNTLNNPALGIMPGQLKQDVVDYLRSHPDETIDVTAGGESAETIRTPDETIGLFSSKEERNGGVMRIYSVASRHNASFDDFRCRAYLGCCYFKSEET